MLISLDSTRIMEDDSRTVFGADVFGVARRRPSSAFSLGGPPRRRRRMSTPSTQGVHLRPWGDGHLLLLWDYWHADCDVDEPPVDVPSFDADLYPEVCLQRARGFHSRATGVR